MTTLFLNKSGPVGAPVVLDADSGPVRERPNPRLPHVFVDILSLDAGGQPVTPGAGTYTVNYTDQPGGGYKSVDCGGVIDATLTGGAPLADGLQAGASFAGNPLLIKVTPVGVTVATQYRVTVKQSLS